MPCEVEGVLREKLFEVGEVVSVGQTIAIIDTDATVSDKIEDAVVKEVAESASSIEEQIEQVVTTNQIISPVTNSAGRFYSPLVKNIANEEGITEQELDTIQGTGAGDRVTKNDILEYIALNKKEAKPLEGLQLSGVFQGLKPARTPIPSRISWLKSFSSSYQNIVRQKNIFSSKSSQFVSSKKKNSSESFKPPHSGLI